MRGQAERVRPYQPEDQAGAWHVMAETAFFGEPVEAFLEDRRLFCEAFCASYTRYEPETAWITAQVPSEATGSPEVVGVLLGCSDTRRWEKRWRRQILPGVLWKAIRGGYRLGPRTWRYASAYAGAFLRGHIPQADLEQYPAHLHINLLPERRGFGWGSQLIGAYLEQLKQMGVPGVHLHTTNLNQAACRMYTRLGFDLLAARPLQAWRAFVPGRVESRLYGMKLPR